MEWTETVAVVRDIAIIVLTVVATAALLIMFTRVNMILSSIRRITKTVEHVTSVIASSVGPSGAGSGFLAGLIRVVMALMGNSDRRDID